MRDNIHAPEVALLAGLFAENAGRFSEGFMYFACDVRMRKKWCISKRTVYLVVFLAVTPCLTESIYQMKLVITKIVKSQPGSHNPFTINYNTKQSPNIETVWSNQNMINIHNK